MINYNYFNGLIILDSFYTSIQFKISDSLSINKDPNLKLITIEFPIGTMSSSITQYQIIEDVPLVEGIILLDNNFITINDNIYYFKQKFNYITQYVTDFLDNQIIIKDSDNVVINIKNDVTFEDYKTLLSNYIIIINTFENFKFNCTLQKIDKTIYQCVDYTVYTTQKDLYITSIDVREAFRIAITDLTGIQAVTSIDQRLLDNKQLLEYFQISDGMAVPENELNTRIIFNPQYGRIRNNSLYLKLNYFTKDIRLYERRYHSMLLRNDINRLTTFKIFDYWNVSVEWVYRNLPSKLNFDDLKLDENSKETMLYSMTFEVRLLFFIVESNIEYPKILSWIVDIITGGDKVEITG